VTEERKKLKVPDLKEANKSAGDRAAGAGDQAEAELRNGAEIARRSLSDAARA